jgi:hypothetical protein
MRNWQNKLGIYCWGAFQLKQIINDEQALGFSAMGEYVDIKYHRMFS